MATIGLRDMHYAILLDDPILGQPSYETPERVPGAISANINPNSSTATLFSDDGPSASATTLGEIELEINLADIPLKTQAVWLGHAYEKGILKRRSNDVAPYLAFGFRALQTNGTYRYIWLTKGKFSVPKEEYNTKGESIEFGTPTITGSFLRRDNDDEWQRSASEDAEEFDPSYIATWFMSPLVQPGASATNKYGDTTITLSGVAALKTATVTIAASDSITAGNETAVWVDKALTITLANGIGYSREALQALIDSATGTPIAAITITTSATLNAVTDVSVTLTFV